MTHPSFVRDYSILRYTALHLGRHLLLLPQREVAAIIEVEELHPAPDGDSRTLGMLPFEDRLWRVYDLDAEFRPARDAAGSRRRCVLIDSVAGPYGLLCDDVSEISRSALATSPIAPCMRSPDLLFNALGLWNDRLVYLTSDRQLAGLLSDQRGVAHG